MRKMLREMESELEKEIAECAKGGRSEHDAAEVLAISERVIGRLNSLSGKGFKVDSESALTLVRRRLSEGFTEEQLLLAVEETCRRWKDDPERRMWIRPETILGEHFESYLQEAVTRPKRLLDDKETVELWTRSLFKENGGEIKNV